MSKYDFKEAVGRIEHGDLTIGDVSSSGYLKMEYWIRYAGAIYPVLTRETKWRPQFLLDSKKHNPHGLRMSRGGY